MKCNRNTASFEQQSLFMQQND